ncbi:3-oxoacyl-[acyl-carrier-protein] synthase III C-terminal domain-containing protein [Streptomyces shenzhenensis]|uniref:3-oxoacyl-[acyl-carrier-protein] synthase III C-terminal domain-containing protein n=1 Tax=Streptomyces shenzhenensis TaxID=943815 RepID=UPI00215DBF25|nr:3-oxoacyl-[acyl-carrier-protein] synthase III C-terminal domain-containing protein [Streptomyces shenzhenensis]
MSFSPPQYPPPYGPGYPPPRPAQGSPLKVVFVLVSVLLLVVALVVNGLLFFGTLFAGDSCGTSAGTQRFCDGSGWESVAMYGLATAAGLIASRVAARVLLIGADTYSTIVDPLDRANAVVFGDGAGAVVLRAGHPDEPGAVGHFDLGSDGAHEDLIMVAAGGSRWPYADGGEPTPAQRHFAMRGREVYRHAVTRMAASARTTLQRGGRKTDDVDHFVPHQANLRILHSVADDLGLPRERCVANVDSVGNTGAASIPLALADAAARGRIRPGDRLLLTAFGGGLTWGSCLLTWPSLATHPQSERTTP